jgi:hypothetical protein
MYQIKLSHPIVMGLLGALQKTAEQTSLARRVDKQEVGKNIGSYHLWTCVGDDLAVIGTGYLAYFLTIGIIFLHCFFVIYSKRYSDVEEVHHKRHEKRMETKSFHPFLLFHHLNKFL